MLMGQNFDGWTNLKHLIGKILADCPGAKERHECPCVHSIWQWASYSYTKMFGMYFVILVKY